MRLSLPSLDMCVAPVCAGKFAVWVSLRVYVAVCVCAPVVMHIRCSSVTPGTGGNDGGVPGSMNQAVLEINPTHPIVQDLDRMVKTNKDSEETQNFAVLLYDVAGMTSGYEIGDTKDFATRVMTLMSVKARDDNAAVQDAVVEDSDDNADDEPAKEVEVLE